MDEKKIALRKFVLENYLFTEDEGALKDDDSFLDNGILDSMGVLELISFLEEELSTSVEGDEVTPDNLDSINKVLAFIETRSH
ncbi:acyl carrier protein [bacterium]|jgi:acyl carrier protein|nr:acyl carrier protein [Pseudomonadales bacterium]MDB4408324.1 acyl carrier protein [bacterium]MDB4452601.1 acyl carrier protein [bacterium]MDG1663442.1 acyl carrier protein [Pseudomonadales bacterium]MDG2078736.1 acyl carrier protein [Pseudomonadales bacterium]